MGVLAIPAHSRGKFHRRGLTPVGGTTKNKAAGFAAGRARRADVSDEADLLRAVVHSPAEAGQTWLVLADLLEERSDARHELIRLEHEPDYRSDLDAASRQRRIVELLVAGVRPCVPAWTNDLGMRFVWCSPGIFTMGSPPTEKHRSEDEGPRQTVRLTSGFWLADAAVTQAQWREVMGTDPGDFRGDDLPVEHVSWNDAIRFCRRLGRSDRRAYRLPTEAEWEYACRAGTETPFFWGPTLRADLANFDATYTYDNGETGVYRKETLPVYSFPPNAWGLYQMHGNVWEWCADWFSPYSPGEHVDPAGPGNGSARVLRGGSWYAVPRAARSAHRRSCVPDHRDDDCGFRPAFSLRPAFSDA
jgi:uncharacterized protein (TIGR02996 family)